MRKVEATIRKLKFKDVKVGLIEGGFNTFTYWAVRSVGENSEKTSYKDSNNDSVASERVNVSIVVRDEKADQVVDIIVNSGQTHEVDDALIHVIDVPKAFQIVGQSKGDRKILKM